MKSGQQLKNELKQGKSISEVCHNNNITFKQLLSLIRQSNTKKPKILPEHVEKVGRRYQVVKRTDGDLKYYGSYLTVEDAIEARDKLIENNWDLPVTETLGVKFILKHNGYWKIQRKTNQGNTFAGVYKTLEDAIKVRDLLVQFDWDLDYLNLICRKAGVERIGY